MNSTKNTGELTFEDQIQELIDKMHNEAEAANGIYESRPDKKNTTMPLAFGEALGFGKGVQQYADELQTLLIKSGPKGKAAFANSIEKKKVKPSAIQQEGNPIESFSLVERTIPMVPTDLIVDHFPTEAAILTPMGVASVKIYAMCRDGDKVLFGIGNEELPILGWKEVSIFYKEWPD